MGDWIHTTDINGNKGWLNIKTNQFRTTAPSQGTIQQNTARYLGYRPNVKADRIKAAVKMAKSYNSRQYKPHNHSDETIKLKQKHQEVIIDKKGEPRIIQADFTPKDETPMKITGPEKLLVETVAVPVTPVKFGAAALAGKFGSGALQRWGRNTILEDAFKNVVDKGLTNTAESQVVKQTAKEVTPKYNEVRYISINTPKSAKDVVNNFTSKVNGLKNLKNQSLEKSNTKEATDITNYDAFLSELADKESALDQINSKLSQKSRQAASKYVQTGHAKPLTQLQQNTIAHKVGSDFTGQYIIEPSGLQKAFGKVQINKIKNLRGKTEGVDSLLPVEVGQTTTLYSPKTFILENSNKPSLFGFYPEQDLGRPRNVVGMYYTKYDLSTADPSLTPKSPLYTLIHERNSHGTDNLMSKLKVALRWEGDINKNPIHTVQEHYYKLINDIVANNPELNLDGSKLWYELRATNNEVTARAYQKVFKDAKKAGKIPQDASINDKGVIESLRPAYEQEIDKLTPESLAKIYASVNGYGEDYAKAIQNAIEKAQSTNNTEELNTFIDNLKSGIKYLPAAIPVGIGLNQNQYKNGGKMKIYFAKKGIHIKKQNEGKFTEYCGGKVTQDCINRAKASGDSKLVKRAVFAENAKHWKHQNGGTLTQKIKLEDGNYLEVSNLDKDQLAGRKSIGTYKGVPQYLKGDGTAGPSYKGKQIKKGQKGFQIPNSPAIFRQYGINPNKFINMFKALRDKGLSNQVAFETTWQSNRERPKSYYSFGVTASGLQDWANKAHKSLTIGNYKAARDSTNFNDYRRKTFKYNTHPWYTDWLLNGRNQAKQFINNYIKQNHLGQPVTMVTPQDNIDNSTDAMDNSTIQVTPVNMQTLWNNNQLV